MDSQLVEFLRSKVPDWDDDVVSTARFKAFSGQRCDWEARFQFWRRLIIGVSRHLGRIIIDSDEVKTKWFVRQGLIPLCLEEVLLEMYRCGDLAKQGDLEEYSGQRFQFLFKWIKTLVGMPASNVPNRMEGKLILIPLLEVTEPLVHILRIVDGDNCPMGKLYEAMDLAKEAIANFYENDRGRYKPSWDLMDIRWNRQLHRLLHAATYFLNPCFVHGKEGVDFYVDEEVKVGFLDTLSKLVLDEEVQDILWEQHRKFVAGEGALLSKLIARRRYTTYQQEKLDQVLSSLKEMHWSNVCIITIKKFEGLCGGSEEASGLLAYLLRCRRAQRLVINTRNCIEGIKILLEPSEAITNVSQLDLNILHLHWTLDMLHKQLSIAEKRYDMSKDLAIKEAKSGHRQIALKHLHNLKLAVNSRTKLQGFVDKVEEVLRIISDLDSAKKVSDAIKLGAKTIKEHAISIEEVCECMEDLDETVASHKQIEDTLQSLPFSSVEIEEGELEAELANLELELEPVDEPEHIPIEKPESPSASIKHLESHEKVEHLVQKLSKMELKPAEADHA